MPTYGQAVQDLTNAATPGKSKIAPTTRLSRRTRSGAIHDVNVAEDALRAAALSFSAAMAEFLSTIAVLSAH